METATRKLRPPFTSSFYKNSRKNFHTLFTTSLPERCVWPRGCLARPWLPELHMWINVGSVHETSTLKLCRSYQPHEPSVYANSQDNDWHAFDPSAFCCAGLSMRYSGPPLAACNCLGFIGLVCWYHGSNMKGCIIGRC